MIYENICVNSCRGVGNASLLLLLGADIFTSSSAQHALNWMQKPLSSVYSNQFLNI